LCHIKKEHGVLLSVSQPVSDNSTFVGFI